MVMSLSLIDGVVASERYETGGNPVEMNLVIATTNIVTSMNARVEAAWLRGLRVFNTCLTTLSLGEGTAGVPRVKLRDNFAEHHDGRIMHWLLFDTELADSFSREFIAPVIGRPLEKVEASSGTQDT